MEEAVGDWKTITQEQTFWGYVKQQSGCLFI